MSTPPPPGAQPPEMPLQEESASTTLAPEEEQGDERGEERGGDAVEEQDGAPPEGGTEPVPGRESLFREYVEALLIAIVFAIFARTFVVQAFKIPSESMEPNLLVGDHILVNKFVYGPTIYPWEERLLPMRGPRRGDVVVFKFPQDVSRDFIKRCVGLAGDEVEIEDKQLLINGAEVDETGYAHFRDENTYRSRFVEERWRLRDNFSPYEVPPASYFCLGDNRDFSNDSRYWGPVPAANVKGRAVLVYWSFETPEPADDGLGEVVSEEAEVPAPTTGGGGLWNRVRTVGRHFFTSTRWNRTFTLVR